MYQGRLVAEGSPQALKDRMRAGVMLEVTCREPLKALRLLRAEPALTSVSLFGRRLHVLVEEPAAAEPVIRGTLGQAEIGVDDVEPIALSLEDLFVLFIQMEEQGGRERVA
jgi:ABC-2 type transport system ATP-binding protein